MTNLSSARCKYLLDWYCQHARPLPWRETREPYAIWVSEIMLQQTQVKTVLPRYQQWLQYFPDIFALAQSSEDNVLKAWEGLGYYRRARFMHAAAQQIVRQHHGSFPQTFDGIIALPGIGRSTAGAIASFCFGASTPVLDGNVKRVFRRWHALANAKESLLWRLAQDAINSSPDPALWNQTMMELGATLCNRTPDCAACPVQEHCASAFHSLNMNSQTRRQIVQHVHWKVHLHLHPKLGIWLSRRPVHGIWGGLWAPPITELSQPPNDVPDHIHQLTHRRLHLYGNVSHEPPTGSGQWCHDLSRLALPTGILQLLRKYSLIDETHALCRLDDR